MTLQLQGLKIKITDTNDGEVFEYVITQCEHVYNCTDPEYDLNYDKYEVVYDNGSVDTLVYEHGNLTVDFMYRDQFSLEVA